MKREYFLSAVYMIIRSKGNILLQRRTGTALYSDFLGLPAGHIDQGKIAMNVSLERRKRNWE